MLEHLSVSVFSYIYMLTFLYAGVQAMLPWRGFLVWLFNSKGKDVRVHDFQNNV